MIFHFNQHDYETQIVSGITKRLSKWFGSYRLPVASWVSHGNNCCDYWQPMTVEDLMKDDILTAKGEEYE